MIPKIIHYTWFSGDPFPPLLKRCFESWEQLMPDYELRLWDFKSVEGINNIFLQEALSKKKWAFAADFVRLYALNKFGGIYLDTDVEVFKNFDPLLNCGCFIGRENSWHIDGRIMTSHLTSHCMGAMPRNSFIKACLDYYKGRHFILSEETWLPDNLKYDQRTLPLIQNEIAVLQGYKPSWKIKNIQVFGDDVKVYPYVYFDCHYKGTKTYCKHWAAGGWRGRELKNQKFDYKYQMKTFMANFLHQLGQNFGVIIVKDDNRNNR